MYCMLARPVTISRHFKRVRNSKFAKLVILFTIHELFRLVSQSVRSRFLGLTSAFRRFAVIPTTPVTHLALGRGHYMNLNSVAGLPITSALIGMGVTAGLTVLFVALAMRRLQNVEF